MKPFWNITNAEAKKCLGATTWHPSITEYFPGGGWSTRFLTRGGMPVTMCRLNLVKGLGAALQIAEGWTVDLPAKVHDALDQRTNPTWPTTWFAPNLTGRGAFRDVYSVMNNWGANHGSISYGHIGADLISLASMLRIPVTNATDGNPACVQIEEITIAGSMTTNLTGNDFKKAMLATSHSSMARQVIRCGQLPDFDDADLAAVRAAFASATPCAMGQEWRAKLEHDFAPGQVRVGWRLEELLVFAELTDRDIFSHATGDNQLMWELGATFEMFLRPAGQTEYFELHVTPNNHRLQLRFPDAKALERLHATHRIDEFVLPSGVFHSRTWVQPENQRWFVFAGIPALVICGQPQLIAGSRWYFSFSRYDYRRGDAEPVISSTSPHPVASFHRQEEWGELTFVNSNS